MRACTRAALSRRYNASARSWRVTHDADYVVNRLFRARTKARLIQATRTYVRHTPVRYALLVVDCGCPGGGNVGGNRRFFVSKMKIELCLQTAALSHGKHSSARLIFTGGEGGVGASDVPPPSTRFFLMNIRWSLSRPVKIPRANCRGVVSPMMRKSGRHRNN